MASSTVRISRETQDLLREIAHQEGASMQAVLEKALREYRQKQFFESVNLAYANLKQDPKRWQEELAERRAWDVTLTDGRESD
jgi:hypothetical protein